MLGVPETFGKRCQSQSVCFPKIFVDIYVDLFFEKYQEESGLLVIDHSVKGIKI